MINEETLKTMTKGPVSLIYDNAGQVIGNSQELAITLLALAKALDSFSDDVDAAADKMGKILEGF